MNEKKPISTTCIRSHNTLYEMVFDQKTRATSFVSINRSGALKTNLREVEIDEETYIPMSSKHNLLECNVVRLPSRLEDYGSEQELLLEIKNYIHKYLDVSPVYEQIATYYVLFTWLYEKFNDIPYLRAMGDYGSGKSRFLQTIGNVCYKPMFTGGATSSSPIFRIIQQFKGTLIVDEADLRSSDMTTDMVKVLNSGYQKNVPVLKTEGKGTFDVKSFDVFCPKIIATRERYADTALESRFLVEEMGERKVRDDIPRTLNDNFYKESLNLRNKLLKWRMDHYFQDMNFSQDLVADVHPRLQQIVLPLFSIIKSPDVRNDLTEFITQYNDALIQHRDMSWECDIVMAILHLRTHSNLPEVLIKDITDCVNRNYDERDQLTPRKVGYCLKEKLRLQTRRISKGIVINFVLNEKRIEMWKERYGITDETMHDVYDVHDVYVDEIPIID